MTEVYHFCNLDYTCHLFPSLDILIIDRAQAVAASFSMIMFGLSCKDLKLYEIRLLRCLQEILLVLDGTTGLNMLPQAREFNEVNSNSHFWIPYLSFSVWKICYFTYLDLKLRLYENTIFHSHCFFGMSPAGILKLKICIMRRNDKTILHCLNCFFIFAHNIISVIVITY